MDWPGLLKWTMKNTEGSNLIDKDLKPMSEEDAKWLEEAIESFHFNEMKEIMKILDKLKQPEIGTKEDEEERCFLIEDLLVLIDGLENNRNIVRAKRLEEIINYFFTTKYKEVKYSMASVLTSMMQNDKFVQDAAVNLNLFKILEILNETEDKKLLAKCVYILSGLIYGENLNTKLKFLDGLNGLAIVYNLIIKEKENYPVFKRVLNILREITKIEDNDSELNQVRLKALLKIMDLKMNQLILAILKNTITDFENKEVFEYNSDIRAIVYDLLINICKSFESLKEVFDTLTALNDRITKSAIPEDVKKIEKNLILEIIKKLKYEYNRKEEIKHKDGNIQILDEKAVLLNLKKEEETNQGNQASSELLAANVSTSTSLALHNGEINNNLILLPPNDEKK